MKMTVEKLIAKAMLYGCAVIFKPTRKGCLVGEVVAPDKTPYHAMGLNFDELIEDMNRTIDRHGNKPVPREPIKIEPDE